MNDTKRYRHPAGKPGATLANALANCRWLRSTRRWLLNRVPFPVLESDVRDVVYLNWVVPLERAARWVPAGVELQRHGDHTILTVLAYRHGHFGPRALGPLRRLLPSPLQSNWRFYVSALHGRPHDAVLFIRNYFDSWLHAIGSRIGSDALPSELAGRFAHARTGNEYSTTLMDADGHAALSVTCRASTTRDLPAAFAGFHGDWTKTIACLTLQDHAIVQPPDVAGLALAGIALPIDVDAVQPLDVTGYCAGPLLQSLGADAAPFAFLVPSVHFRVLWERMVTDTRPTPPPRPEQAFD